MKHLFIINPKSFELKKNQDKIIGEIESFFARHPHLDYSIHVSRYPRDAIGVIRKAATRSPELVRVYAVGGDGILFDCLNGVARLKNTQLACLPYSPPNTFIRAFGEESYSSFRDLDKMVQAPCLSTDVIDCGSNQALGFCSIGVESAANMRAIKISAFTRRRFRMDLNRTLRFTLAGVQAVCTSGILRQSYSITLDGQCYDGQYATINIANIRCYSGSLEMIGDVTPQDGLLDVILVKSVSAPKLLQMVPDYVRGDTRRYPQYIQWVQAKEICVSSSSPLYLNLDGETFFDNNITIKAAPRAVEFVVPPGLDYAHRGKAAQDEI